jgi:hypothetical protein
MHTARAACFRPTREAHFLKESFSFKRDQSHVGPLHARTRIEIDAQLVRMFEIVRKDWMWMQLDTAKIDDPHQSGFVVDDDFFCFTTGRERKRNCVSASPAVAPERASDKTASPPRH